MENASLEELKTLFEEEIYLIPEDRQAILDHLDAEERSPSIGVYHRESDVVDEVKEPAQTNLPAYSTQILPVEPPVEQTLIEPIPVRGNFSKGVLILHEEDNLPEEVMEMLMKMIKACGHSMSEVGMVSSSALENRSMEEFQNLNAHTVLKFGRIKHPVNAIPARVYEVYSEKESEYLFADSLSEIAEDKNLKVKLWTSLQVLFNLSPKK
jgi:hypothetical protein